jgi:hypothetical protein
MGNYAPRSNPWGTAVNELEAYDTERSLSESLGLSQQDTDTVEYWRGHVQGLGTATAEASGAAGVVRGFGGIEHNRGDRQDSACPSRRGG